MTVPSNGDLIIISPLTVCPFKEFWTPKSISLNPLGKLNLPRLSVAGIALARHSRFLTIGGLAVPLAHVAITKLVALSASIASLQASLVP